DVRLWPRHWFRACVTALATSGPRRRGGRVSRRAARRQVALTSESGGLPAHPDGHVAGSTGRRVDVRGRGRRGASTGALPAATRRLLFGRRARRRARDRAREACAAEGLGGAVSLFQRHPTHAACAALCLGLALPNLARASPPFLLLAVLAIATTAALARDNRFVVAALLLVGGWCWGSLRLEAIDRSPLSSRIGTAERTRVVVTAEPRRGRFDIRAAALVVRFGSLHVHEPVLLRLPLQRAPPQGAILAGVGQLAPPRPASNGFDERAWLRRHGIHVLLRLDTW